MQRAWDINPWSEGESGQGFLKDRFLQEDVYQCHQQYSTEANTYKQWMSGSLSYSSELSWHEPGSRIRKQADVWVGWLASLWAAKIKNRIPGQNYIPIRVQARQVWPYLQAVFLDMQTLPSSQDSYKNLFSFI